MDVTILVLGAFGLGSLCGALILWTIHRIQRSQKERAHSLKPTLPPIVGEVLEAINQYAVIIDSSLTPIFANTVALESTIFSIEKLKDSEFLYRARQVLNTGIPDSHLPDPDDPKDTLRIHIFRIEDNFLVVLVQDMGESHRVNAIRRDFIANVSHELKTPISAISLLSEAVLEAADDPETIRSFAKRLLKTSRRLSELSRDLIQLSEAQSVEGFSDRETLCLPELLKIEVDAHSELAEERSIQIVIQPPSIPEQNILSYGQPAAVSTAIANVLSNAIRHSPNDSHIDVSYDVTPKNCTIIITDYGEGISADQLPRIFERFYRIDSARSRKMGGTGLGLSIAKHTMRAHGGNIQVVSRPGHGSTFSLTFPIIDAKRTKKFRETPPISSTNSQ